MKAVSARRKEASPNKISFDTHSFVDRTHLSAYVQVWTPRWELNRFYTTSRERRPKHRAELGVAMCNAYNIAVSTQEEIHGFDRLCPQLDTGRPKRPLTFIYVSSILQDPPTRRAYSSSMALRQCNLCPEVE